MGFTDKQLRALARGVPAQAVRTRMSAGKELSFIEGWYALAQANRIFGFDGWDRETVETKLLRARETRGTYTAIYAAKVRVTVRTEGSVVVREGHGTGEGQGTSAAEVQDRALKAAETDATKRALATFGKAFGLALYAGDRWKAERPRTGETHRQQKARPASPGIPAQQTSPPSASIAEVRAEAKLANGSGGSRALMPLAATSRIQKNLLTFPEPERIRDKDHLRFVAAQPCLICSATPSDPHHLRFAQPRALARKVGDDFTVPLCRRHHRELHDSGNESAWWHDMGIEPLEIAHELWKDSRKNQPIFGHPNLDEMAPRVRTVPDTPERLK
jgi:hypothetical protein